MLMTASHQWATRPDDQRFTSLDELLNFTRRQKEISRAYVAPSRKILATPTADGDHKSLVVIDPQRDEPIAPTHFAFGQLCALMGAPAGYLRQLPAALAADNLNYGAYSRNVSDVGLMTREDLINHELAAATGPNYGRVWNAEVVGALRHRFGDGVTGDFTVPGEFGRKLDQVTKANTTLYASDRDMFVFLADETNRIEVPNPNGGVRQLARGFFVWNSEVGSTSLGIATFLFDYVCMNRIVWGPREYREFRIRHTSGAPLRWVDEVTPALEAYAHSATTSITEAIEKAQKARLEGDGLDEFLARRFNRNQLSAIKAAHVADESRPIETLYDVVQGVTAYARGIRHQDERVSLEREAGKVLDLAIRS